MSVFFVAFYQMDVSVHSDISSAMQEEVFALDQA